MSDFVNIEGILDFPLVDQFHQNNASLVRERKKDIGFPRLPPPYRMGKSSCNLGFHSME
jgi:hypothetical protein